MGGTGEFVHTPVLLRECMEQLKLKEDGIYMDGTLGGGGHSYEICRQLGRGHLYGIDQDAEAIAAAGKRLEGFGDKVSAVHANYREFRRVMADYQIKAFDGILLDLGVSSYQLDNAERGFSYRVDAPLDMRMDGGREQTAKDIINGYSESELFRVIRDYGEEKFAKNIAKHIIQHRADKPIETTYELNEIIKAAIPAKFRINGGHPSKRTFQAIRIELNAELTVLEESLAGMIDALAEGGRLCVITFHSLEDRIVKKIMKESESPCICPSSFPVCVCGRIPLGSVVTRKPILPSEEECEENPRAKSAKLRVFERRRSSRGAPKKLGTER